MEKAVVHSMRALTLSREIGDRDLEARSLHSLGLTHWARGRLTEALRHYSECLAIVRQLGNRHGEVPTIVCLAETNCDAGRYQEADALARSAVAQSRVVGERRHEVGGLEVLAMIDHRLGHHAAAIRDFTDALRLAREIGFGYGELSILIGLCGAHRGAGRLPEALACGREASAGMQVSGTHLLQPRALTELARAYLDSGDRDQAARHASEALELARERGQLLAEARALHVQGLLRQAEGDAAAARHRWRAALELFVEIGAPEAEDLRPLFTAS
ncbi:tetratricopeptide repeat protein [Amycolatopsis anabasis]|uniref:tetratricopeptide repeat protein n=1 Tax=Amycolatopsis anabasis TaxID=1840409 RepID=UPI00131EC7DE